MEENDCEEVSEMNLDDRDEIPENSCSVQKRKVQLESYEGPLTKCARIGSSENSISENTVHSDSDSITSDHVDSTDAAITYSGGSYVPDTHALCGTVASNDAGYNNSIQKAPIAKSARVLPSSSLAKAKKTLKLHRCRICLKIFADADYLLKHVAVKHSGEANEQTSKIPEHVYETADRNSRVYKIPERVDEMADHNTTVYNIKIEQEGCELNEIKQEFQDPDVDVKKEVQASLDKELGHDDLDPGVSRENGQPLVPESSLALQSWRSLKVIKPPGKKAKCSDDKEKLEEQGKESYRDCQEGINENEQSEINKIRNFTTEFCKIAKNKHWMPGSTSFWCEKCGLRLFTAESLRAHQAKSYCGGDNTDPSRQTVPSKISTTISSFEPSNSNKIHSISKIEPRYHWCATCRLSFGSLEGLRRHNIGSICNFDSLYQSAVISTANVNCPSSERSPNPEVEGKVNMNPVVVLRDGMKGRKQTPKATFRVISAHTLLKGKVPGIADGQGSSGHLIFKLEPSGEGLGKKMAARIKTEAETENEAKCESEAWDSVNIRPKLEPESEAFCPVKIKQEKKDIVGDPWDNAPGKTFARYNLSNKYNGCHLCGMTFATDLLLKSHMSLHGSNGNSEFVCSVCNMKFTEIEALLVHQNRENHNFIFPCYFCHKRCVDQATLNHHLREQHRGRGISKPRCLLCDMEFEKESDRDKHMRTHLRQLLLCEICDLGFLKQDNLTKHLSTHSQDDIHSCRICAEHFGGVNELRNHMETHRFSHVNSYIPGYFKDHVKFNSGAEKCYICNICNVGYSHSNIQSLNCHLLAHQQQQIMYDCPKCWMHFVQKTHLRTHKRLLNH